ncbi:tetratricopeptide repeat protein [bacterium]|nr:tetratricopeptide repeat protein [bacterium]
MAIFLWGALLTQSLSAQSTLPPLPSVGESADAPSVGNSVRQQGEVFESQKQWGEALALYQNALKANPDDQALQLKRAFARIHFDLDRRYADTSFIKTIKSTDANTSMNVYAEVLLKIQSYYVDEPNWANIVNYGLTSLKVAMQSGLMSSFIKCSVLFFRQQKANQIPGSIRLRTNNRIHRVFLKKT